MSIENKKRQIALHQDQIDAMRDMFIQLVNWDNSGKPGTLFAQPFPEAGFMEVVLISPANTAKLVQFIAALKWENIHHE